MPPPVHDDLPDFVRPQARPWPLLFRVLAGVVGSLFLMLGFLGFVLPFLPGVPFLIVAAFLLGRSSADLCARMNELERRLPTRLRYALRLRRRPAPVPVEVPTRDDDVGREVDVERDLGRDVDRRR